MSNPAKGKTCPINLTGKKYTLSPPRKTDNTPSKKKKKKTETEKKIHTGKKNEYSKSSLG